MTATVPTAQEAPTRYNVVCNLCDQAFTPTAKSALWWKAKKHEDEGFLDVYRCAGMDHGCIQGCHRPDAPFRVFGFDRFFKDFDVPCDTFVEAVIAYRRHRGDTVLVKGLSDEVQRRLELM